YSTREGFGKRYGIVYIDAAHDFKRITKDSFYWYAKVIATNGADLAD
ncbi:MAG: family 1 glycosylhydrolase, partial [Atopobiaceae bacterium]|nr:family 1 glycosylhydrolase [Atopobiaceae bacterium]